MKIFPHGLHPSVAWLNGEVATWTHGLEHAGPVCGHKTIYISTELLWLKQNSHMVKVVCWKKYMVLWSNQSDGNKIHGLKVVNTAVGENIFWFPDCQKQCIICNMLYFNKIYLLWEIIHFNNIHLYEQQVFFYHCMFSKINFDLLKQKLAKY